MQRTSTEKLAWKLVRAVVMSAAAAMPVGGVTNALWAQDAAPANAGAVTGISPVDPALRRSADDYWHYVQVARYELANAEAKKLAEGEPLSVLKAFQAVASERKADLDTYIARWVTIDPIKDSATALKATLDKGRLTLRGDQSYIEDNIKRLVINERAYQLAVARLRQSGELAVPLMIQYLRSPEQVQYHGSIRRALTDMGKTALSPLLASTQMKDARVLTIVVSVLGDMGYEPAVPYLLRLSASPDVGASVRQASALALQKLGASANLSPADAFYQLAEKFYYDNAMITANLSGSDVAYVWYWSEDAGLTKKDVSPAIFNELQAMRACEYSLTQDRGKAEALSLWLASNYKREVELPTGATDTTREAGQPNAHYYGVAAGARYLNDVLTRTLKDRNSAVALKAVRSLEDIVGTESLFNNGTGTPLSAALSYPDRVVRFEAAYTLGSAMPQQQFAGSDQVVPILAEAIAQTGKPGVVVLAPTDEAVNKLVEDLKAQGYNAVGTKSAEGVVNVAAGLPAVDSLVVSEDVALGAIDQLLAVTASSPRLARTPKLILTKTGASPFASRAAVDVLVNTTTETDPAKLKDAIEKARARGGANPLSEDDAKSGALRAIGLIRTLAVAKSPVLNVLSARGTLISALDDSRPEIAKAAADTLAVMGQKEGQLAILTKATGEKTPDDLKVAMLKSLSTSAKTFGNQLPSDGIAALEKMVVTGENLDLRSAAAEARGALNLPPEEAKVLILKQAKF
jgi:hypothetical protein